MQVCKCVKFCSVIPIKTKKKEIVKDFNVLPTFLGCTYPQTIITTTSTTKNTMTTTTRRKKHEQKTQKLYQLFAQIPEGISVCSLLH